MSLSERFRRVAADHPDRVALVANEAEYSYRDLASVGPRLSDLAPGPGARRVAILADRDIAYYAAVFSSICLHWTYVPLNPAWPVERIRGVLDRAELDFLIVDAGTRAKFASLWEEQGARGFGIFDLAFADGDWRVQSMRPISNERAPVREGDGSYIYIMFTSGSTGEPKGVPITFENVESYVRGVSSLHRFTSDDVFAQIPDLAFDLSVHDLMVCWFYGGRLVSVPSGAAGFAPRFIRKYGCTITAMVPSAAAQSKINGLLAPGTMPSLRASFFCGEPLSGPLAKSWAEAAPNVVVYNLYGPTEATCAVSAFAFDPAEHADFPTLPLGKPWGDQRMALSESGEIMLSGPQLAPCYLNDPARTAEKFPAVDGRRWYLTGDRGSYDDAHGYLYLGRLDSQIKLRGYRVELGDIEAHLRAVTGTDFAAIVPVDKAGPSSYNQLVAFVCGSDVGEPEISGRLKELLPPYMMPNRVIAVASMPQNANGKIDRGALARSLASGRFEAEIMQ